MMDWLTIVYFIYTFLAFYLLFVYILIYLQNYYRIYETIKPKRIYDLSIVVPCYNESKTIGKNIEALINSDYKGLKKIIVVDDCSTDNSFEIIKEYEKRDKRVMAIKTPRNTGRAAGAKNYGAKFVKTELIGFSDGDSVPKSDAISNMVGYFNDKKVGAVCSRVMVRNRDNLISKIQAIEYKVIAMTRKLNMFVDSIFVTNGPLSIYRKEAFDKVGGFSMENLTEDIEITWNIVHKGYSIRMAMNALVYTEVPARFKDWFRQRIRWNVGGMQTVAKYFKHIKTTGMLGLFVIPLFVFSWFIGITGLFFLIYRFLNFIYSKYLITKYAIIAESDVIRFEELGINPSLLFFFGMFLFSLGFIFTIISMAYSKEKGVKKTGIHNIFIYSFFYLLMYPVILVVSFYNFFKGRKKW